MSEHHAIMFSIYFRLNTFESISVVAKKLITVDKMKSALKIFIFSLIFLTNLFNSSFCLESIDVAHENCAILPGSIHVIKEELDVAGNVIRSCEGDFLVNKCEATCVSSLQPSVVHSSGFLKKCNCCRESRMKTRSIRLNHCFDPDGKKMTGEKGFMEIEMEEPESCHCLKCSP